MTKEMGFLIALCATAAVGYALLTHADRIRTQRRFARRRSGGDSGMSASSDSWSLASWFSGDGPSSNSYDSSGNPVDFGSCGSFGDSGGGGGGDCGGGSSGID
jgi:hypothetical protein